MKCIGCGVQTKAPAAYAIMSDEDLKKLKAKPAVRGKGRFHAATVCDLCFRDPSHRKRTLKAHYALPDDVGRMLGRAGSSSIG
jgi:hypothetical protein